ncbi:MAG: carboxypeptidase-like regulatory domain-containing protein [Flavobacteriales bacterium]
MVLRLILFLCVFNFFSRCNAQTNQNQVYTLTFANEPLVKVLKTIKKESGYRLAYQVSDVKRVYVSAAFSEADLEEIMSIILPKRLSYSLINDLLIIYQTEEYFKPSLVPRLFDFEFSGQVIDFFTGEVLPYASLNIISTGDFYQTNQEGTFRIETFPADTSQVEVSYIGYRNVTLRPNQLDEMNETGTVLIKLKPETTILSGAVVKSYESTPILSKKEAGLKFVNVLQNPQMTNIGESDALTLVRFLPGFDPSAENNMGLGTRGLRADENLYYLDGYAIFNPDHFFGLFSSLNSLSIKNIRVLKSAYAPEYGGRSSSLFDITSYSGNNNRLMATVKSGFLSTSARIDGPIIKDKLNFSISGRASYVDALSGVLYEDLFNAVYNSNVSFSGSLEDIDAFDSKIRPELSFADVQSKISYKPTKTSLVLVSGFYGEDYSKYQISDLSAQSVFGLEYLNEIAWQNYGGSLSYSHQLADKIQGKYVASYSKFISQSNSLEEISFLEIGEMNRTLQSTNDNSVTDLSLKTNWTYSHSDSLKLNGGFEINDYQSSLNLFSFGIPVTNELLNKRLYSVFSSLDINRSWFDLKIGFRAIYDQTLNEAVLEPRIKSSVNLTKKLSVKGAYGRHNQFLRRLENFNLFRGSLDAWRLSGETSVPRSESDHLVAGVHYGTKEIDIDVEVFRTWQKGAFEDLSLVLSPGNQNASEFIFGTANTIGLEFTGQKNIKRNNFSISYALIKSNAEYTSEQGEIFDFENGRMPRHNFTGLWLWENEKFSFSLTSNFTSGRPHTPAVGSYVLEMPNNTNRPFIIFGQFNGSTLPNYFRTDVSVSWKNTVFSAINLEISGSVQNIFNANNVNFITYGASGSDFDGNFLIFSRNVNHFGRLFSVFLTLKI